MRNVPRGTFRPVTALFMYTLEPSRIATLLAPYSQPSAEVIGQLSAYLDLLVKWNARTNLTAIRDPEGMVTRHFGESLFAASVLDAHLPQASRLLDFGSGAGFPGLPIQLVRPDLRVALAESQNKKAAFLREAVRTLGLPTEVVAGRVEALPAERVFDAVTLRAVDNMAAALEASIPRAVFGGLLCLLTAADHAPLPGFEALQITPMPGASSTVVALYRKP